MFPRESIFEEDLSTFFDEAMPMPITYMMDDVLALADDNKCRGKKININDEAAGGSKKRVHRDIEKQRRQEMATLYAALRSLLPLQYVKGKRAVCDHMEQAVNYIKDTQNKIEEAKMRRNKMKKMDAQIIPKWNMIKCEVNLLRDDGMEILISTTSRSLHEPLSKVVAYLVGLGLNVTTLVSTRSPHHRYFHKLHIQQQRNEEIRSIDVPELKQRLLNLIN